MKKRLVSILVAMMVLMTAMTACAMGEMTADKLDTYYNLAVSYVHSNNNPDKAIEYLDIILSYCNEETSKDLYADLYLNKSIAYIQKDDYATAMTFLDKALENCDDQNSPEVYADVRLKKGCVYTLTQDYENALAELDEVLRLFPDNQEALLVKTQVYTETGENAAAAEALEKYIELSGSEDMYETLSKLYTDAGDSDNAIRTYKAYLDATQVEGAENIFTMANYKLDSKLFEEAAADYESILKDETYGKAASYNLGVCQTNLNDYENALASFEVCLENPADFNGVYYNIGVCYRGLGKYAEAAEAFRKSAETEDFKADALYNGAICCVANEDFRGGADGFTAYLEMMEEQAKANAQEGEEVKPYVDDATYFRGVCYLSLGEYQKAKEDLNACIENEINKYESLYSRALVNLGLEDTEAALADMTTCIENGFELSTSYKQRGNIYNAMGDVESAQKDWEESLLH